MKANRAAASVKRRRLRKHIIASSLRLLIRSVELATLSPSKRCCRVSSNLEGGNHAASRVRYRRISPPGFIGQTLGSVSRISRTLEGSTSSLQLASNVGALRALDSRNFDYEALSAWLM